MIKNNFIKPVSVLIGLALLIAPSLASADAISDLQAQIVTLTQQLNGLVAQFNNTSVPPTVSLDSSAHFKSISSSAALSISGITAPGQLQILQKGTWQIFANDATDTDPLSYTAVWGDASSTAATGSAALTHSYATAGTYMPQFTVVDASSSATASASTTVVVSDNETPPPPPSSCPAITQTLSRNMTDAQTGGQISALQNFLVTQGFLSAADVSGFFGALTEQAMSQFQAANNIEQVGFAGPQTRNAISKICNSGPSGALSAAPASGAAPLSVTFSGKVPGRTYTLDFGDGSNPAIAAIAIDCPATNPTCGQNVPIPVNQTHIYAQTGTYTATVKDASGVVQGTATVTVGGSNNGALTATPTSGAAPLTVQFTGSAPGNTGYTLDFGDGSQPLLSSGIEVTCPAPGPCTQPTSDPVNHAHVYAAVGTYTATLKSTDNKVLSTTTITVSAASGGSCNATLPTHDLSVGQSDSDVGGDVTLLQQFLVAQGTTIYPEQLVTGFFGNATAAAVRRFQQANNVSPVSGFVGPLTRAAMKALCGGQAPSSAKYSFTASPSSGTSPLSVTFTAANAETLDTGVTYVVDFGDGARGAMTGTGSGANTFSVSHTYTAGGTFQAKLLQERNVCGGIVSTGGCVGDLQVDSASVAVTAAPAPTSSPTPTPAPTITAGPAPTLGDPSVSGVAVSPPSAAPGTAGTISWTSTNAAPGAQIALDLIDAATNMPVANIGNIPATMNSFQWTIDSNTATDPHTGTCPYIVRVTLNETVNGIAKTAVSTTFFKVTGSGTNVTCGRPTG